MNNQPSSIKKWILIGGVAVIAIVMYFYFNGKTKVEDTNGVAVVPTSGVAADESQVLSLLNQIRSLHIDSQLFQDPSYTALIDYSVRIPEQGVGRPNPFAPLAGEVSKTKTTTTPAAPAR